MTPFGGIFVSPGKFQGYTSVKTDDDGLIQVRDWIKQREPYSDLRTFLGNDPIFRKFGSDKVKKRAVASPK